RLLPRGRVLDVGAGTGAFAGALAARGYRVTAVDDSLGMLRVFARQGATGVVQAPSDRLPFRSDAFDLVASIATFHHVADPAAVRRTVAEMVRVARPGGRVLVWDHNPRNPYWPRLMRRMPQDQDGCRLVPLAEVLDAFRAAGVRHVRARQGGWIPDFAPRAALPLLARLEALAERTPGLRRFGAHNIVVGVKPDGPRP